MLKEPEAKQWWVSNCDGEIVRIAGFDSDEDPVIEHENSECEAFAMDTFLAHWHHEPDCDGFYWVKPVPVPVESPDDLVTQDIVVPRNNIDEWAWVTEGEIPRESQWERGNGNFKYKKHGDKSRGEILHVRCRRKDLPKPPEPAKTRVEFRLWVCESTGSIRHSKDDPSNACAIYDEVLFDTTGQPYYLKD